MKDQQTITSARVLHFAVGLAVILVSYSVTLLAVRYVVVHLLSPVTWL